MLEQNQSCNAKSGHSIAFHPECPEGINRLMSHPQGRLFSCSGPSVGCTGCYTCRRRDREQTWLTQERDPVLPEPGTAEDVDTSTTVQGESSPTPRSNQRDGTAPLPSLSPLFHPPFSPLTFTDSPQAPQGADVSPTPATPRALVPELSSPTPLLETLDNHMPSPTQSPSLFFPSGRAQTNVGAPPSPSPSTNPPPQAPASD